LAQAVDEHTPPSGDLRRRGGAAIGDRAFRWLALASGLLILVILALILSTMLSHAWPALRSEGLRFFTSSTWVPNDPDGAEGPRQPEFGALAFLYGSLVVSLIALAVAVPVSLGIALFLTELAPRRMRSTAITVIDLLAAIPSVVFGMWGLKVLAGAMVPVYEVVHDALGWIPFVGALFGEPVAGGRSFMTAGLVVAIMITPIITSISREVFATVPEADKQAAVALGATRWEMIRGAVFPHSFGGIVGAVMLGLGRALGETIAIALLIGASVQITPNLFQSGQALPAVIVNNWQEAGGTYQAALIACGVLLFLVTVVINYAARLIVRRAERRMKGA